MCLSMFLCNVYINKSGKFCFQHDLDYGNIYLVTKTAADKVLLEIRY